jgi:CBS domain-containing protein
MATHLQGVPLHESRVSSAMAREVRCCSPADSAAPVQTLMQHHKIRRVPVVDAERRLVGIVSLGDLAYLMGAEQAQGDGLTWTELAHTLSAVSTPRLPRYRR